MMAGFSLALAGAKPSRATIAYAAPGLPSVFALRTIGHEARNSDETRPWPELSARTKAPWHTRLNFPPGLPTSVVHWRALPEGRASEHEDEDGPAS